MNPTRFLAMLAKLSRGAVPVDGILWSQVSPVSATSRAGEQEFSARREPADAQPSSADVRLQTQSPSP
jgi:hypothetical protein